jgi:beta-glucosidase
LQTVQLSKGGHIADKNGHLGKVLSFKMMHAKRWLIFVSCAFLQTASAQEKPPYKDRALPIQTRLHDLLNRMTPEEKFRQLFMIPGDLGGNPQQFKTGLFGLQVNTASAAGNAAAQMLQYSPGLSAYNTVNRINAIQKYFVEQSRLGIPIIAFDEALHGLVRSGATAFPQSIALAATWDTLLMRNVATAIAKECKLRGIRQVLSPVVNLATDVRWGRVEETYGEDPVLSSAMGVAFVRSFERMGIVATPKHFVLNHGEGGRDSYPVDVNERLLEEIYFVPFKACIQQGGARSIMTAYNSLNGRPCSANDWLLNKKLKAEWGFRGFVISDAGAVGGANVLHFTATGYEDAGKQSIENGLDVIFQTDIHHDTLFNKPFLQGKVNQEKLDSAVARVLRIKFELGLFDEPYVQAQADSAYLPAHRQLAKDAAASSMVLLKNDARKVLPLSAAVKKIAVIGLDAAEARLGGYSGPGNNKVSMLDALRKARAGVRYAEGCGRTHEAWTIVQPVYLPGGLQAEYFNNIALDGKPALKRTDAAIDFQWTLFSPHPLVNYDFFSARWLGFISSPKTGNYKIGIDGNDGYKLYLDNKLLIDTWNKQSYGTTLANFYFEKGKKYSLRVEYKEPAGNARFKLIWNADVVDSTEQKIAEAVRIAKESDVIIVAAGIEEGEFRDRSKLSLPGRQEEMILRLAATGKPVVVVLFGGSAITMNTWLPKVNAVLHAWYPGEAGGEAIAEILFGRTNPSGKLPISFPLHEGQLPLTYNHKPTGRGDDYADGSGQALFPFGYGLSYTQFEYTNSRVHMNKDGSGTISFTLKNTGQYAGDEVVQLYVRDELASVAQPVKALKAFQRVYLESGEEKTVSFNITPAMLSILNEQMQWVVEPGAFRIMIGSSSKDIRIREMIQL